MGYGAGPYGAGVYGGSSVVRRYFSTPTIDQGMETIHPLFRRYTLARGVTVLVTGATVKAVQYPAQDDLDAADRYYLGGHIYQVSDDEVDVLTSAGYGNYITGG